jgi:hypothetical protein
MINIPAYCDNCQRWTPSGFIVGNVKDLKMSNNTVPCGFCGRNGARVIEGTFNIIDDVLEVIESNGLSLKELERLTQILQDAIERNMPAGRLREIIAQDVPKASKINKFITDGFNLSYILGLILVILAWQFPVTPVSSDKPKNEGTPNQKLNTQKLQLKNKTKRGKVGVNTLCICGSGRKSKKCCGFKR